MVPMITNEVPSASTTSAQSDQLMIQSDHKYSIIEANQNKQKQKKNKREKILSYLFNIYVNRTLTIFTFITMVGNWKDRELTQQHIHI